MTNGFRESSLLTSIFRKVQERGLLWAVRRSGRLLLGPVGALCHLTQKMRAISAAKKAAHRPRTLRQVVFVSDRVNARQLKMAWGLHQAGWQVILLHRETLGFDAGKDFSELCQYHTRWEVLWSAAHYTPMVYHVFSSWNFDVAATLIRYKPGKVVFDDYDLLTGMVKEEIIRRYPGQLELEQYCLANADGLCCRGMHTQYLKRYLGYRPPKRILFPEHCWAAVESQRTQKRTDGVHIVYVGNLELDPDSPTSFQYQLAALLSSNSIHFHIYPAFPECAAMLQPIMAQHLAKFGNPDFVHIHDTVPPNKLIDELAEYHYGIIISTDKIDYHDEHSTYYQHVSDYITANKVFDYMDAGLFIFTQGGRWLRRLVERHGNGKVVQCLQDIVTYCKQASFVSPAIPNSYRLLSNIGRLTEFYVSLT